MDVFDQLHWKACSHPAEYMRSIRESYVMSSKDRAPIFITEHFYVAVTLCVLEFRPHSLICKLQLCS